MASNPEFLKEGNAIEDFLKPDRIVVGTESERAEKVIRRLYKPFVLNGHPMLFMDIPFTRARIGTFDVDLFSEFFQGFVNHSLMTIHLDNLKGKNSHHQIESIFKAFARALRMACEQDPRAAGTIASTKGTL